MNARASLASGGPSTRRISGPRPSKAARSARAQPGPWWRTPKICTDIWLHHLVTLAIQVFPAVALFDDGLQVFEPDDAILHRILDDGARQAGGKIGGVERAVAIVG